MEPKARHSKTTGRLIDIDRHVQMVFAISPDLFASLQIEPIGGALTLDVTNHSGICFGLSTRAHPERGIFADARVQIGTDIDKALLQFFERQAIKVSYDPKIPPQFSPNLPIDQLYSFEQMPSFP